MMVILHASSHGSDLRSTSHVGEDKGDGGPGARGAGVGGLLTKNGRGSRCAGCGGKKI